MPEVSAEELAELKKRIETLQSYISRSRVSVSSGTRRELEKRLKPIMAWHDEVAGAGVPAAAPRAEARPVRREEHTISDFFEAVAKGVVATQKKLDTESKQYNDTNPVMPTTFRMPKASAELTFGFQSLTSEGFNIILASSREEEKETMQHRVSFDIVAAPPPPDYTAAISEVSAVFPFVGNRHARRSIRERLRAYTKDRTKPERERGVAQALVKARVFPGVLCFDGREEWLLVEPKLVEDKRVVDLTRLSRDGARLEFVEVREADFEKSFAEFFNEVFKMLYRVREEQVSNEMGRK